MSSPLLPYFEYSNQTYADRYFFLGELTLKALPSKDCPNLKNFYEESGMINIPSGLYCFKVNPKISKVYN